MTKEEKLTVEEPVDTSEKTAEPVDAESAAETVHSTADLHGVAGNPEENSEEQQATEAAEQLGKFLAEVAKTQEELEKTKKELQDAENRYLRLQADFDNFKRRTRQEKEELGTYANEQLIKKLLPVLDNFQRALDAMRKAGAENILSGAEMIQRQLIDILAKEGLEAMSSVGTDFDPTRHDAVMYGEADGEFADGIVMEEMQKGYLLKEKVIRPAMVKVAKG
ncbi:nucleotide exchange factor GrpE [Heliobacterium mobile]|uniref:nucleotide exchange factor GrpE n=1 Tax=Heliobacterium mobile TaxID=28064 RepID=UPI001A9B3B78|nr:nucleotide exchange factor GrpE [Heliobacterium mobile]